MGYPLDTIFVAGHSMGGAFLETYIPDNLRPNYAGVLLFGSWIAREGPEAGGAPFIFDVRNEEAGRGVLWDGMR